MQESFKMKEEILSGLLLIALAILLILPQTLLALFCIIVTNSELIFAIFFISYIPIILIATCAFDKKDDRNFAAILCGGAMLLVFENAAFAYAATIPDNEKEEICEELNLDQQTVTIYKSSYERLQEVIKEIKSDKNNHINFLQKEEYFK